MIQSKKHKGFALAAVTSVVIAVAGILHLEIAFEVMTASTFAAAIFLAFGIPQLGWVIPTIRQLGNKWYAAGIAWNGALVGFFLMTRTKPSNWRGNTTTAGVIGVASSLLSLVPLVIWLTLIAQRLLRSGTLERDHLPLKVS